MGLAKDEIVICAIVDDQCIQDSSSRIVTNEAGSRVLAPARIKRNIQRLQKIDPELSQLLAKHDKIICVRGDYQCMITTNRVGSRGGGSAGIDNNNKLLQNLDPELSKLLAKDEIIICAIGDD